MINASAYAIVRQVLDGLPTFAAPATLPEGAVEAARRVLAIYYAKDPGYSGSWARRGPAGAFHNVARKFDRIAASIEAQQSPRPDDLLDLATYSVLQLALALYERPAEFQGGPGDGE